MRRIVLAVTGTVAVLVLLLGFKSQSAPSVTKPAAASSGTTDTGGSTSTGSSGTTSSGSSGSTSSGSTSSGSTSSGSTTGTKTVTGDAADTRYGPVQVKISAVNGKITSVDAVDYPQNSPRDQEINSYAIPQLNQEALAAGTANIDVVSGATYTTDGYIQSLQSALDKLKA